MSLTKTKLRNIIQYELLDALLRIHVYLSINNICCQEFNPTKEMLSNFNSKIMYNTNTISEDNYSEVFDLMYEQKMVSIGKKYNYLIKTIKCL